MTEIAKLLGKEWKEFDLEKPPKSIKKYLEAAAKAMEEVTYRFSVNLKRFESDHCE